MNLLSRFESAALNDVTKSDQGAELFARGVHELVYGAEDVGPALDALTVGLQRLNARGTAPAKWPIVTFFPFIARPERHLFVKPAATKLAAERLGFELNYKVVPNSLTYARCAELAARLKDDLVSWAPKDNIDIQGFIWVTYSSGY